MKRYLILTLAGTLALTTSCNDQLTDMNLNPNVVEEATPGSLLTPVLYEVKAATLSRSHRLNNELMQVSVTKIANNDFHRYEIRSSESDYLWDRLYRHLTNVEDIYDRAVETENVNYQAVALTLRTWIFSLLTDLYGDVPYREATLGYKEQIFQPNFDPQQDIYAGMLQDLETANRLYAPDEGLVYGGDVLYDGDVAKWQKFTNSLRLRLLLRVLDKPASQARETLAAMVANPAQYPIFESNDDAAVIRYTETAPYINPFTTYRNYDFNGERAYSEFFLAHLTATDDPRLPVWATQPEGSYTGLPSGYPVTATAEMNTIAASTYQLDLKTSPLLGVIMGYPEVAFILAELAQRDLIPADAQPLYETGVEASLAYWEVEMLNGFLAREGVAYDGTLEQIMLQKYYALLFTDFQQWFEHRRTGFPKLPVGEGTLNGGQMPRRLLYPVLVQSVNATHYQEASERMGGDDVNSHMWWDQ